MNKPWDVLQAITKLDSKLDKQEIIAFEAAAANDSFFKGTRAAFDGMITFGVKKIDTKLNGTSGPGITDLEFYDLAKKLADRDLTGGAAKDAINALMDQATVEQWNNWYRLVLLKDLKAGFSESTLNKVCEKKFPAYAVPVFSCQLAKDCADDEGNVDESLLCGLKQIDTKFDGTRCLSFVYPNGTVVQYSRNGKEWTNFGKIKDQLSKTAGYFTEPMVIDAEVMSKSFQQLMKQARRKSNVDASDAKLFVFDILPLKDFMAGICKTPQKKRSAELAAWFDANSAMIPNVELVEFEVVDLDTEAGQTRLLEINKIALAGKYEGIMIKDPEAPYECKRSLSWMKLKPFIEVTLEVYDVEEGKPDSRFVGTMGALKMRGTEYGKDIDVSVGGGYSIQLRAQIWANFTGKPVTWKKKEKTGWVVMTEVPDGSPVVGRLAEVRADAITKSDGSATYSLRFPRYRLWRGFAKGEKL